MNTKQYDVLGVRIDALTMKQAAEMICERAVDMTKPAAYVVKPYVEFLDRANRDQDIQSLLNGAWLSLPDAVSLQWATTYIYGGKPGVLRASKLAAQIMLRPKAIQKQIPEKFSGTTFTWKLLEEAAHQSARVYLVGSPVGGNITHTAELIEARLPNISIVGTHSGELDGLTGEKLRTALSSAQPETELLQSIKKSKANLILVGMGFPLQETLIAKLTTQLPSGVLIGEGGTFDYTSFGGQQPKAPQTLQTLGLEWAWRLLLQPRRIKRQLAIPRFMRAVYTANKR